MSDKGVFAKFSKTQALPRRTIYYLCLFYVIFVLLGMVVSVALVPYFNGLEIDYQNCYWKSLGLAYLYCDGDHLNLFFRIFLSLGWVILFLVSALPHEFIIAFPLLLLSLLPVFYLVYYFFKTRNVSD